MKIVTQTLLLDPTLPYTERVELSLMPYSLNLSMKDCYPDSFTGPNVTSHGKGGVIVDYLFFKSFNEENVTQ